MNSRLSGMPGTVYPVVIFLSLLSALSLLSTYMQSTPFSSSSSASSFPPSLPPLPPLPSSLPFLLLFLPLFLFSSSSFLFPLLLPFLTPDLTLSFVNPRLLDDVSFHPCVRYKRWEVSNTTSSHSACMTINSTSPRQRESCPSCLRTDILDSFLTRLEANSM